MMRSLAPVDPEPAEKMFNEFVSRVQGHYKAERVKTGVFGAYMDVSLVRGTTLPIEALSSALFLTLFPLYHSGFGLFRLPSLHSPLSLCFPLRLSLLPHAAIVAALGSAMMDPSRLFWTAAIGRGKPQCLPLALTRIRQQQRHRRKEAQSKAPAAVAGTLTAPQPRKRHPSSQTNNKPMASLASPCNAKPQSPPHACRGKRRQPAMRHLGGFKYKGLWHR